MKTVKNTIKPPRIYQDFFQKNIGMYWIPKKLDSRIPDIRSKPDIGPDIQNLKIFVNIFFQKSNFKFLKKMFNLSGISGRISSASLVKYTKLVSSHFWIVFNLVYGSIKKNPRNRWYRFLFNKHILLGIWKREKYEFIKD